MKSHCMSSLIVPILALLSLLIMLNSPVNVLAQDAIDTDYTDSHLLLNYNLGTSPPTLDPAFSNDSASSTVITQLFGGLVEFNDETGAIEPGLAVAWLLSRDKMTYTFTLRSDMHWSDGSSLTAEDIRYSLLRLLHPDTNSPHADLLFFIKNGEAFHNGSIQDPDLVGISSLSPNILAIEMAASTEHALNTLAQPQIRPVPQHAIDQYGENWTAPENIVVSGPYDFSTISADHLTLHKNDFYFATDDVQIERVNMWFITDADAEWQKYVDGELDTAIVPANVIPTTMQAQQITKFTSLCTYYYGFNTAHPPFDNVLVRKAFSSAVSRAHLAAALNGPTPAVTFIPPGLPGYVNGYAEGIGLPYNPDQAREWLATAGYADGVGLPEINIWFNTGAGHQSIAELIGQSWEEKLGANVKLNAIEWSDFLDGIDRGDYPVWRLGWCADYPDGLNFLRDGVSQRAAYGNWSNPEYEDLLAKISTESDPTQRQEDYNRAQKILVETDAVMMPIYFFGGRKATKLYLHRTDPAFSSPGFAKWWLNIAQDSILTSGGKVVIPDQGMSANVFNDAFNETVDLYMRAADTVPPSQNLIGINRGYDIIATDPIDGVPVELAEGGKVELLAVYDEGDFPVDEETLAFYYWDGDGWVQEPSSEVDPARNEVIATTDHLSLWAVFGETERVFLPVARDRQ